MHLSAGLDMELSPPERRLAAGCRSRSAIQISLKPPKSIRGQGLGKVELAYPRRSLWRSNAPDLPPRPSSDSGSKLRALQTLRVLPCVSLAGLLQTARRVWSAGACSRFALPTPCAHAVEWSPPKQTKGTEFSSARCFLSCLRSSLGMELGRHGNAFRSGLGCARNQSTSSGRN